MHHFCSDILLFENKSTEDTPIVEGQARFTFVWKYPSLSK